MNHRAVVTIATLALFAAAFGGCERPGSSSGSESGGEEAAADPPREQAASDLPGVETIPVAVKQKNEKARKKKAQREDPTYRTHHMTEDGKPKFTNRLITASSPYLRQHAHNPVNWHPWSEEAFEKAKREDKPVLLSVGYSTCHWCHVMERESFEDLAVAEYLNKHYVAIKVDREQNPHVDDTYMSAVRMFSGGGGWPMTVWLTPQKLPFMGGTYYPKNRFLSLLKKMKQQYDSNPAELRQKAQKMASKVNQRMENSGRGDEFPDTELAVKRTFHNLDRRFDEQHAGFGRGQKFPGPAKLQFLLRYHKRTGDERALEMATETLDAMKNGGIYDDIGGGFHRYATDRNWLTPHFEKMLYDNAQLALVYTEAWQATGDPEYARIVEETLNYLVRDMTTDDGALYAATDADSPVEGSDEREEGIFFVWAPSEVREVLPEDQAELVIEYYDITESGNFEGANILHTPRSRDEVASELGIDRSTFDERLERARTKLYHAREQRPHPHRDDNLITGWNGLGLEAFARAAIAFDNDEWLAQSRKIGRFILEKLRDGEGHLLRNRTYGEPGPRAFSSDYAFAIAGLLNLYEATGETDWLRSATELQNDHLEDYWDDEHGGFFQKADDSDSLIGRKKPDHDGSTPSANSYAALNLLRLYQFQLDESFEKKAEKLFEAFGSDLERRGPAMTKMLVALDFLDSKPREIAFVKPSSDAPNPLMNELRKTFLPNAVLVPSVESDVPKLAETVPWMEKKETKGGKTTAYVCRDFTCKYPTNDPSTFSEQISETEPLFESDSKSDQ